MMVINSVKKCGATIENGSDNTSTNVEPLNTEKGSTNKDRNNAIKLMIIAVVIIAVGVGAFFLGKSGNSNTYDVMYDGFKFKVPNDLIYEVSDKSIVITDKNDTWASDIKLYQHSFSAYRQAESKLKKSLENSGFTASTAKEKNIGNNIYIIIEASIQGENALYVFSSASSNYTCIATLLNNDNEFDYTHLNTLASILGSVTYTGESSSLKSDNQFSKFSMSSVLDSK